MKMRVCILVAALVCVCVVTSLAEMPARFSLGHRDRGFSLQISLPLDSKEVAFAKEPDFGDHKVVRSAIPTGPAAKEFIGFAWDRTAGKLHVDLNGDLDLTNDEGGTFKDTPRNSRQEFDTIRLVLDHGGVSVPYVLHAYLYTYSGSRSHGYMTVQSGWRGELEFHGARWSLSVVDNLDGIIDRQDEFILSPLSTGGSASMAYGQTVPGASGLVLAGKAYDLDFTFTGSTDTSALTLDAADADIAMGTLDIDGTSIKRLVLHPRASEGYLVVGDEPGAAIPVPAGSYGGGKIYLDGGENLVFEAKVPSLTVTEAGPATLKAGGPLDNTAEAEHRGSVIELSYELRGAGGEEFRGLREDRRNPPRFVVRKGPLKLHSGKFEYG